MKRISVEMPKATHKIKVNEYHLTRKGKKKNEWFDYYERFPHTTKIIEENSKGEKGNEKE